MSHSMLVNYEVRVIPNLERAHEVAPTIEGLPEGAQVLFIGMMSYDYFDGYYIVVLRDAFGDRYFSGNADEPLFDSHSGPFEPGYKVNGVYSEFRMETEDGLLLIARGEAGESASLCRWGGPPMRAVKWWLTPEGQQQ